MSGNGHVKEPPNANGSSNYAAELGDRLRQVRLDRDLTLKDVGRITDGRWTPGTLGAYERGTRSLRPRQLADLAAIYGISIMRLLPSRTDDDTKRTPPIVIDMARLRMLPPTRTGPLRRLIQANCLHRSHTDILRLRASDLRRLAKMYRTTPETLYRRLDAWGILVVGGARTASAGGAA